MVAFSFGWPSRLRLAVVRWRIPLTLAAATIFFSGLGFSVYALGLRWSDLSLAPIVFVLLVLAPLSLSLAALSLQLTARAVRRRIEFREAIVVSAAGNVAEILPVPGGAMVRGAALVRLGAGVTESAWIVTLTAVLTLAMAALLGSVALIDAGSGIGYLMLAAGLACSLVSAGWIAGRGGPGVALAMVGLRLVILVVAVARIVALFAAIGTPVPIIDAALFAIASTLGTALSIIPAGLGVGEALAAALALLVAVSPAAAFVAVGFNRILSLCVSGAVAGAATLAGVATR